MSKLTIAFLFAGLVAGAPLRGFADDDEKPLNGSIKVAKGTDNSKLPAMAKVAIQDALAAALKKSPGKALKVELEGDEGSLIYSVDIVNDKGEITVVELDAGNGAVLAVEKDEPEAGEGEHKACCMGGKKESCSKDKKEKEGDKKADKGKKD